MTRIAELRRERKLTQVELAMAAGVSRTTVAYLEQGYVPRSSYYAIPAIADALGVDPESLTAKEVTA